MAKASRLDSRRTYFPSLWHEETCVPEVQLVGWSYFGEATANGLGPHAHADSYEVCFIKRGTVHWWVDSDVYEIQPGQLYLTAPDEWHGGVNNAMDACELYWVIVTLDPNEGCLGLSPAEVLTLIEGLNPTQRRTCQAHNDTARLFEGLLTACEQPGPLQAARIRASMTLLLHSVWQSYADAPIQVDRLRSCSPRIQQCLDWLESTAHQHPSVEMMAAQAGLAVTQFRHVFRRETGYAPQEYVIDRLLRRAKDLLANSKKSITSIALDLGFSSSQYFATAFRRQVGMSPRAFRQQAHQATVMTNAVMSDG